MSFKYLLNLCREINGYQLHDLKSHRKKEQIFLGSLESYKLLICLIHVLLLSLHFSVKKADLAIFIRNPKHCRDHTAATDLLHMH